MGTLSVGVLVLAFTFKTKKWLEISDCIDIAVGIDIEMALTVVMTLAVGWDDIEIDIHSCDDIVVDIGSADDIDDDVCSRTFCTISDFGFFVCSWMDGESDIGSADGIQIGIGFFNCNGN